MKGTISGGFEYEIMDGAKDDIELLEALRDLDRGNILSAIDALEKLIGVEQKKRLYEHLRDENGKVSGVAVMTALTEMLDDAKEQSKDIKNS